MLYPGVGVVIGTPAPAFALLPPQPNPSDLGGPVTISFRLPSPQGVSLSLYDVAGRRVAQRHAEAFAPGPHAVRWDPGPIGAGIYILQLRTTSGGTTQTRLVVLR
jgi:hypothetical protein